jgi:hypothetical protein
LGEEEKCIACLVTVVCADATASRGKRLHPAQIALPYAAQHTQPS